MSNPTNHSITTIDINTVSFVLGDDPAKTTTVAASDYAEYDALNIPDALMHIEINNGEPNEEPMIIAGDAIAKAKVELVYAPIDNTPDRPRTIRLNPGKFIPGHLRDTNTGRVYLPSALRVTI